MKKLALVISSAVFLISCSKDKEAGEAEVSNTQTHIQTKTMAEEVDIQTHPIKGYWVSDDYSYILSVGEKSTEFRFLNRSAAKNPQGNPCANVTLNETQIVLNCELTKGKDFGMALNEKNQLVSTTEGMPGHLNRVPNVSIQDLTATWYDKESNGKRTTIYVTHHRGNEYDLETFDVYEREKKYKYYSDKNYKVKLTNGFTLTEQLSSGPSVFYIVEFADQWYRAVDQTGYSWIAQKYDGDMKEELKEQGYILLNNK